MKEIQFCKVTILAIGFLTSNIQGSVIRFQAYPSVIKTNLTSSISMRCSLANTGSSSNQIGKRSVTSTTDDILHISSIYITNSNGDDVAAISPYDAAMAYVDIGNLQVKGDVTGTSSEGYLELSWKDASAMSMGGYECNIHCTAEHHRPVVFSESLEITEVAPTITDVISKLNQVEQQQVSGLEQVKQQQIKDEEEMRDLKQCLSRKSGFTAAMSQGKKTVAVGQTVVFDKVIYSTGSGYDPSTGIFTCNEPGIYFFSVNSLSSANHAVGMNIMLNSDEITTAYASDNSYVNTAATSALVHLNKNDTVRVKSDKAYTSYFYYDTNLPQANVFVGQMEQSDCIV